MDDALPISFDDDDRRQVESIRAWFESQSANDSEAAEHGRRAIALCRKLVEDLDDAAMLYSAIVEHSTALENELSTKNDTITKLINKMKRYLSEQLYRRIVGGKVETTAGSHQRQSLTIFFSDIVGFTNITDTIEPETLSYILNAYLNDMAKICSRWGGAIDKFIGDAVMIYFGDDEGMTEREAARRCVMMAIEMQESLDDLRREWRDRGCGFPLQIRIGINSGFCTVGNFGSEERMDYTLIGGNVNVASRLEGQATPGGILVSATTYQLVEEFVEARPRGKIQVKGVAQPIETFEIIGPREISEEERARLLEQNESGFRLKSIEYSKDTPEIEKRMIRRSLEEALKALDQAE